MHCMFDSYILYVSLFISEFYFRISRRYFCERFPALCDDVSGIARKDPIYLERFCAIFPPLCENKNDIYLKVR